MKTPLERAWLGALIGFNLAIPLGEARSYRRLPFYQPVPTRMQPHAIFDWWLAATAYRTWGDSLGLGAYRRKVLGYREGALGFAELNAKRGFEAPLSGALGNPLAEDATSFDRAIYWGLTLASERDVELAFEDLSYDHGGVGLRVSLSLTMFAAHLARGATFSASVAAMIPVLDSTSQRGVEQIVSLEWADSQVVFDRVRSLAETNDSHNARLSLYGLIAALRHPGGFGERVLAAAGFGLCPHAALAVGALAALTSETDLGEWLAPLGQAYASTGQLVGVDTPASIQDFAQTLLALVPVMQPFEVAPDVEPESPPELDLARVVQVWAAKMAATPGQEIAPGVRVLVPGDWQPGKNTWESGIEFQGPMRVKSQLSGDGPVHTRPVDTLLGEGQTLRQPMLVGAGTTSIRLDLEGQPSLQVPVPVATELYACGPLPTPAEGMFPPRHNCEQNLNTKETFAGRSGLGVKWTRTTFPGHYFQLDPLFLNGPGMMVFAATLALEAGQTYTLVMSASPGGVASVNGQELIRALDSQAPSHRAAAPYAARFVSLGADTFTFRLLRPDRPDRTCAIYLLDARGQVVPLVSQQFPE